MSTESRAQKNSQTTWLCSLGTGRRTACERDCRGGGICCAGGQCLRIERRAQKCRMCCLSWCPYFLRFHTLSFIPDLFITHRPSD